MSIHRTLPALLPFKAAEPSVLRTNNEARRKAATRHGSLHKQSAPAPTRRAPRPSTDEPFFSAEVQALRRERDELAIKYQQLQSLLREAHQDISELQEEVKVLRRTVADGTGPPPSVDADFDTTTALQRELGRSQAELASALARSALCPYCSREGQYATPEAQEDAFEAAKEDPAIQEVESISSNSDADDHIPWHSESKEFTLGEVEDFFDNVVADFVGRSDPRFKGPNGAPVGDGAKRIVESSAPAAAADSETDTGTHRQSVNTLIQEPLMARRALVNFDPTNSVDKLSTAPHQDPAVLHVERERDALEEELIYMYTQLRHAKEEIEQLRNEADGHKSGVDG